MLANFSRMFRTSISFIEVNNKFPPGLLNFEKLTLKSPKQNVSLKFNSMTESMITRGSFNKICSYSRQCCSILLVLSYITPINCLIFSPDPVILNSIRATDSVDEVFVKNAQRDDKLIWQYFGSATGFYRSYPGKR